MKITSERSLFQRLLIGFILILLVFVGVSCQSEIVDETPTKIVGTWYQTSQNIDGIPTTKDSTRLLLQINSNNICILCDSTHAAIKANTIIKRSGWSYSAGLLNIAIDLPASWKPLVVSDKLNIERIDFNQSGAIQKTTLEYQRVVDFEIK